jgi:hypothetical protein
MTTPASTKGATEDRDHPTAIDDPENNAKGRTPKGAPVTASGGLPACGKMEAFRTEEES